MSSSLGSCLRVSIFDTFDCCQPLGQDLAAGRHRPATGLGDKDADLLTGLDVRRIAPPELVPQIVRQRLADHVHTLENLPGPHRVADHADPLAFRRITGLRVAGQEGAVRLFLIADVVGLQGLQPVGGVLEAGEQRIELRAGDIGDAPAHD